MVAELNSAGRNDNAGKKNGGICGDRVAGQTGLKRGGGNVGVGEEELRRVEGASGGDW